MRVWVDKRNRIQIFVFLALLLIWDMLARFSGWSHQVFPGPVVVLVSMGELLADGTLIRHTVASLFRVSVGFYLVRRTLYLHRGDDSAR